MATAEELRRLVGQRATLQLSPQAPGAPAVTGRILGVLDALDGFVVTVEPDGAPPGTRHTLHHHYILAVTPASHGG